MASTKQPPWTCVPLSAITTKIGSGLTPLGGKESYKQDGISLIRSLNVYDFRFEFDGLAHIDEEQAKQLSNVNVQTADILLNITGASVARCCMVPATVLPARVNQHVAIVRVNKSLADPHFVFYSINSPGYKGHLLTMAQGGATREALTKATIENFQIALPPLTEQRRIGSVLSAYDDLIENNTRRIKILEEMAQMIYREWFVNFRFPDHENIEMVDSKIGRIPAKWSVGVLEDALVLQRGFDLPGSERQFGRVPVYAATGINGYHNVAKARGPGVITGRSGSLGSVMLILDDFWPLNTTLWVKEFRQSNATHSFFLLSDLKLAGFNSGAAVPTLNRNDIHGLPCLLPDRDTLDAFCECVLPMFQLRQNLEQKTAVLKSIRDLLLPKLICGEISVENLQLEPTEQIP